MNKSTRKQAWAVIVIAASLVLTFVLECLNRHSVLEAFAFASGNPGMFLFDAILVLDTLFITLLFRRRIFAFLLMIILWLAVGIINCIMVIMRTLPFTIIDLTLLKDALGLFDVYFSLPQRILIVGLSILAILFVIYLFIKAPKQQRMPLNKFISGALVLATLTLGCINMGMNTNFISSSLSDLTAAYDKYGFAYCFLATFTDMGIDMPENYSEETMDEVEQQIDTVENDAPSYLVRPNIVFVQLESFFDPKHVIGLELTDDPIPTFTQLKNDYPSGYLTMPSIGGGTANSEFEVLTGMTLSHFGAGEYPYNTVMLNTAVESICNNLAPLNYSSHAIHNHSGSFYGRNKVYPNMGFDTFTSIEYMDDYEKNELGWADDSVLTDEVMDALKSTGGKDFVFCVTVESHGHYPTEQITDSDDSVISEFELESASYWGMDYYLQVLCETDNFIAELLSELEDCGEPTVVVLYGDHLPSLGLSGEDLENGNLYQTEYVIWNNYTGFLQHIADRDLYAYQLSAYVTDLLKIHSGQICRLHQGYLENALPEDTDYMNSLQLLEYDMLYGGNTLYDGEPPYQASNMKLGTSPIRLSGVKLSDGALILEGTGFTDSSEVFYDDSQIQTIYVSPELLVSTKLPEDGARISIGQVTDDGTVLSTTNSFIYREE